MPIRLQHSCCVHCEALQIIIVEFGRSRQLSRQVKLRQVCLSGTYYVSGFLAVLHVVWQLNNWQIKTRFLLRGGHRIQQSCVVQLQRVCLPCHGNLLYCLFTDI